LATPVAALTFTGEGRQIAAAAERQPKQQDSFHIWDLATGFERTIERQARLDTSDPIFSANGLHAIRIVGSDRNASDHDALLFACADRWDVDARLVLHPPEGGHLTKAMRFSLSSDGRTLAIGEVYGRVRVWELPSGRELTKLATQLRCEDVESVAFSRSGKSIAAGGNDGIVKVWDVSTGAEQASLRGLHGSALCIGFAADSRTLAVGEARTVTLWNLNTRVELATLRGHTGNVRSVAFAPDGKTVASGSDDGTVTLWDVRTLQELISLPAQEGGVRVVTFSPDGRTLASGGATRDGHGEIFVWQAARNDDQ
jgi:dipeptidyl aminopeptidase/acylaminoacyl peptidase